MPGHGGGQGRAQERDLGVPASRLLRLRAEVCPGCSLLLLLLLLPEGQGVRVVLKGRGRGRAEVVVGCMGKEGGHGTETIIGMKVLARWKRVSYPHLIL